MASYSLNTTCCGGQKRLCRRCARFARWRKSEAYGEYLSKTLS